MATADSSTRPAHPASSAPDPKHTGPSHPKHHDFFGVLAARTAHAAGSRWASLAALGTVVIWAATGPYFGYSEVWQLVINTGTTIVTFLMVFLIQNAQNRESKAIHLKLDELIRAMKAARKEIIDIEDLSEAELDHLAQRYHQIAARSHQRLEQELDGIKGEVDDVEERVEAVQGHVQQVGQQLDRTAAPRAGHGAGPRR